MDFYDSFDEVETLIRQVFELNPHSVHTLNKHKEGIYAVALDNLNIVYAMDDTKKEVHILKVMYADVGSALADESSLHQPKLRTKEWLATVNEMIDFSLPNRDNAAVVVSDESPLTHEPAQNEGSNTAITEE